MSWFNNPKYVKIRDRLVKKLQTELQFNELRPVVFLCGKRESELRFTIASHLRALEKPPLVFYAESIWEDVSTEADSNALEMENDLAEIADVAIIVLESVGACAELGAFTYSNKLRKKVLPIINDIYENEESFISTGPVRIVNKHSLYKPAIYSDYNNISASFADIEERLLRAPRHHPVHNKFSQIDKQLLFYICDLVSVISPSPMSHIWYYMRTVNGSGKLTENMVKHAVGLAVALDLIRKVEFNGIVYFVERNPDALARPFQSREPALVASDKAEHIGVLFRIPEAFGVIKHLAEQQ